MKAAEVSSDLVARFVDSRLKEKAKNATVNRENGRSLKRMFRLGPVLHSSEGPTESQKFRDWLRGEQHQKGLPRRDGQFENNSSLIVPSFGSEPSWKWDVHTAGESGN